MTNKERAEEMFPPGWEITGHCSHVAKKVEALLDAAESAARADERTRCLTALAGLCAAPREIRSVVETCMATIRTLPAAPKDGEGGGEAKHCPTCICGRRAPVQADAYGTEAKHGPGTIVWAEHLLAWSGYAAQYGTQQSAERLAERGGFSYGELRMFLKREPSTWEPWRPTRRQP